MTTRESHCSLLLAETKLAKIRFHTNIKAGSRVTVDHMQLHAYLIRNRAPNVINSHVHQAVAILSGKKNKVMRQSYVLLVVQHGFNICINRQLLEEAGV